MYDAWVVDGRIILKRLLKYRISGYELDCCGSGLGIVAALVNMGINLWVP